MNEKNVRLNILELARRVAALEVNADTADKADRSDIASEFSPETSYTAGNYVYHDGTLYIFNADHAAGAWDATDVAVANVTDEVTSNKAAIDALEDKVVANPTGQTTATLTALEVDGTKYAVPSGGGGGLPEYSEYDEGEALIVAQTGPDTYGLAWRMVNSNMVRYSNAQSGLLTGNVQEAIDGLAAIATREDQLFAGQVNYDSSEDVYKGDVANYTNIFDNNTAPALIGIDVSYVTKTVSGDTAIQEFAAGHAEFDPQYLLNKGYNVGAMPTSLQAVVTIPVSRVSYNGDSIDAIRGSQLRGYINFSTFGTSAPDTYSAMLGSLRFEPDVKVMDPNTQQEAWVDDVSADSSLYVRVYQIRRGTKL